MTSNILTVKYAKCGTNVDRAGLEMIFKKEKENLINLFLYKISNNKIMFFYSD